MTTIQPVKQPRFQRDFEHDLPKGESLAQRTMLVALPFLSLYRPAGRVLSLGMNASRLFFAGKDFDLSLEKVANLSLSVSAIAGSVFYSSYGMMVTTSHDILLNLKGIATSDKKLLEFLKLTNNIAYMTLLIYGSLPMQIASLGMQVLLNAGISASEYQKGRYLEAGANLLMAGIRGKEMHGYVELYQRQKAIAEAIRNVFVGKMRKKWGFPSDHLPVGVEVDGQFKAVSWNVMNTEYISCVSTQGLNGSMLTKLDVPVNKQGLTERDDLTAKIVKSLTDDSKMGLIALQECGIPFLDSLEKALPENWHIAKAWQKPVKDQEVVLYNDRFVSHDPASIRTPKNAYPTAPGRPLSEMAFHRHSDGKELRLFNAHIPGDPRLKGPEEFAQYVASRSSKDAITVALGDCNFERDRMIASFEKAGMLDEYYPEEVLHTPWPTNIHPEGADFAPGALKSKAIDHVLVANAKSRMLGLDELSSFFPGLVQTIGYLQGKFA